MKNGPSLEDCEGKTQNWSNGFSSELGVSFPGTLRGWAQGLPPGEHLCPQQRGRAPSLSCWLSPPAPQCPVSLGLGKRVSHTCAPPACSPWAGREAGTAFKEFTDRAQGTAVRKRKGGFLLGWRWGIPGSYQGKGCSPSSCGEVELPCPSALLQCWQCMGGSQIKLSFPQMSFYLNYFLLIKKICKSGNHPHVHQWMNGNTHTHNGILLTWKRKETVTCAITWINLEDINAKWNKPVAKRYML